jgi:hypothetical protein
MKPHPINPTARTPYCEMKIGLYAYLVVSAPCPFWIRATRKGPKVKAMAPALLRAPRSVVGAIFCRFFVRYDSKSRGGVRLLTSPTYVKPVAMKPPMAKPLMNLPAKKTGEEVATTSRLCQ